MLRQLSVRDYALVRQLDTEFPSGFVALTGETGSGKSVIVDALGLALGDRGRADRVREGVQRAEIAAEFDLAGQAGARSWLHEHELDDADDEDLLTVRRTQSADGRSRAWINGRAASAGDLRELAELLVDVHAQHEHQSLLRPLTQLRLLDEAGCDPALGAKVASAWRHWRELDARAEQADAERSELESRRQLVAYQLEELDALEPADGEFDGLFNEQKRLEKADEILAQLNYATGALEGEDTGAAEVIGAALRSLERIEDDALGSAREMLETARIHAQEAAAEIARYADTVSRDPERLQAVESRLRALWDTARRQGCEPAELATRHADLQAEITALDASIAELGSLDEEVSGAEAEWRSHAEALSAERRAAAAPFAEAVIEELAGLDMPNARFEIEFEDAPSERGLESVHWMISTNPGVSPGPLARIASGGELSRISLAIQVVAARNSVVPTLILDEADVGIGGATADSVGRLLRRLGERTQLLCITHQPQVAACAHAHMTVAKDSKNGTRLNVLDDTERRDEIARMVGGREVTSQTRAHAQEMLERGQQQEAAA